MSMYARTPINSKPKPVCLYYAAAAHRRKGSFGAEDPGVYGLAQPGRQSQPKPTHGSPSPARLRSRACKLHLLLLLYYTGSKHPDSVLQ